MKRLRYRCESERRQQAGLRLLHQLQLMRLKYGEALGGTTQELAPEAGSAPAAEPAAPPPSSPPAAEEAVYRTEAAATQAEGGARSNDEAPRTPGDPGPRPYGWSPEQVAELIADQRRKRAPEQKRE
jgi:hypothetical protein